MFLLEYFDEWYRAFHDHIIVLLVVLFIEITIKPVTLIARSSFHPIVGLGKIINSVILYLQPKKHETTHFILFYKGLFLFFLCSIFALCSAYIINTILLLCPYMIAYSIEVILVSWLLAGKDLYFAVKKISIASTLQKKRLFLSMIVSRETDNMDQATIYRSSLESLSENFSDGFIAPLLYYVFFGLYGLIFYKMVNTLDSMVGYKYSYFHLFGRVSAKCDDVVNYIPARISAIMIIIAACILRKNNVLMMLKTIRTYAHTHASPNAGVVEASFASALHISLGGPRYYKSDSPTQVTLHDHWIGDGTPVINDEHMQQALSFFYALMVCCFFICILLFLSV